MEPTGQPEPGAPPPTTPPPPPAGAPPSAPPPPMSGLPSWTANITSTVPVAGPAGLYYADVPNRIIAIIIDGVILGIANYVLQIIVFAVFGTSILGITVSVSFIGLLVLLAAQLAVSIAYFTYMWSAMRATIGMRVLTMQIGDASDGHTITYMQALQRAAALWGPTTIGQFLILAGSWLFSGAGAVMSLAGLVIAIGWPLYLLMTTAQSPTKQGFHDVFAHTMVVKAARSVA